MRGQGQSDLRQVRGRLRRRPEVRMAEPISEPEPGSFGLLLRDFRPLTAPYALNPVPAHHHAAVIEHGRRPAVAVTAIVRGKYHDVTGQLILIRLQCWSVSLRSPVLPDHPAGATLAEIVLLTSCIDGLPASLGLTSFPLQCHSRPASQATDQRPASRATRSQVRAASASGPVRV